MAVVLTEGGKAKMLGGKGDIDSVIEPVWALGIPQNELIVVGGAALQVFGIKKTKDIDVVVQPVRMARLVAEVDRANEQYLNCTRALGHVGTNLTVLEPNAGITLTPGDEYTQAQKGNISFMLPPNDHLYSETFEGLVEKCTSIRGVQVLLPEVVLTWKQGVNRPKDREDVALIERYLEIAPSTEEYLAGVR